MTPLSTASFAPARTTGLRSLFAAALLTAAGWAQALELKPFTAEEVKKLRAKKLTPQQVLAERKKLGLK